MGMEKGPFPIIMNRGCRPAPLVSQVHTCYLLLFVSIVLTQIQDEAIDITCWSSYLSNIPKPLITATVYNGNQAEDHEEQ